MQTRCGAEKARGAVQERVGGKKGPWSAPGGDSFVVEEYFAVLLPKTFLLSSCISMVHRNSMETVVLG